MRKLTLAAAGLAFAGTLIGCGESPPAEDELLRPVRHVRVYATGGERTRTFSGTARAAIAARLSFKVGGTVSRVAVQVGDNVRRGGLIAELDPTDLQLQVQAAQATLDQAEAQSLQASQLYDRTKQLYENRNASRNDLEAARAAAESATARVDASEKQLELAKRQLSYARLTAPVAGAIAAIDIEPNENVQPGQSIARLTAGSQLEVDVAMPEQLITRVREGDPVEVTFAAMPDVVCNARVIEVGVAAGGAGTMFPVTVQLDRSYEGARPGMAAEVAFQFVASTTRERYIVPSVAVAEDRQGRFLFVVEPAPGEPGVGIARRRMAAIGDLTNDGQIEVLEGLVDGDFLVTAGVSRITDGQRVRFQPEEGRQ